MPDINSQILVWARETAGLTQEQAVEKLGINDARGVPAIDRLTALEQGIEAPTRPMLVKMSKQYHRPLLTFYLSDVPRTGDRGEDYRTLPEEMAPTDNALVDVVVRDIRSRQELVKDILQEAEEAEPLAFIGSAQRQDGFKKVAVSIAKTLGFDRNEYRSKPTMQAAFSYLRGLVEAAGIFVIMVDNLGSHHSTISVKAFRGFALADDVAPFAAVNVNDSPGAWSFTLVHEVAHLWLGATGISGGSADRQIEKFCNDVASEFLVAARELAELSVHEDTPFDTAFQRVSDFAGHRNVSSTMIAYKIYRSGSISFDTYTALKNAYREAFLRSREARKQRQSAKPGGPSYYVVKQHRAGPTLIHFVDRMMSERNLSATKAGKLLGVGPHNVYALIQEARPKLAV